MKGKYILASIAWKGSSLAISVFSLDKFHNHNHLFSYHHLKSYLEKTNQTKNRLFICMYHINGLFILYRFFLFVR